jgi:hypothetical protein
MLLIESTVMLLLVEYSFYTCRGFVVWLTSANRGWDFFLVAAATRLSTAAAAAAAAARTLPPAFHSVGDFLLGLLLGVAGSTGGVSLSVALDVGSNSVGVGSSLSQRPRVTFSNADTSLFSFIKGDNIIFTTVVTTSV